MASPPLIAAFEKALISPLEALGETQFGRRLFAHTTNEGIWRGLWIAFNSRKPRAIVQPSLGVFCPEADTLVRNGLAAIYGGEAGWRLSRQLGSPVLAHPLYDLVRKLRHEDRHAYSYDVMTQAEVAASVAMMVGDYSNVREGFFGAICSLKTLEERLLQERTPSSVLHAIVVGYLLNGRMDRADLAVRAKVSPNEMTLKFAEWFGQTYAA